MVPTNGAEPPRIHDGGPVNPVVYTRPRTTTRGEQIIQVPELVAAHGQSVRANMVTSYVAAILTHGKMDEAQVVPTAVRLADQSLRALGLAPEERKEVPLAYAQEPGDGED